MKYVWMLFLCLPFPAAFGQAVLSPCPSGPDKAPCDLPANTRAAIQSAIDNAAPGDIIELLPGSYALQSGLTLPNKPGADWITIRTSRYKDLPADGYRLRDADTALLAILYTTSTGQSILIARQEYPRLPLSSEPFSASISGNTLTIGAGCSESAPCRMMSRNGTLLSFTEPVGAITMIPPLKSAGFFTIGIDNQKKLTVGKRPDIIAGTHFTCSNCSVIFDRYNASSTEYEPNSVAILNKTYDQAGWSLDASWKGNYWPSTRIFATGPWAAKGGYGIYGPGPDTPYKGGAAGPHHYRFKGIGFAIAPRTFQYSLVSIGVDSLPFYDYRDMPHDFEFDQCLFKGEREYPSPAAELRLRAENVAVKNSLFRWMGAGGQDSQQIAISDDCPGPLYIENNELDGATENLMAGGAGALLAGYIPVMHVRRNFFWKRLDHRTDFDIRRNAEQTNVLEFVWKPAHYGADGPTCGQTTPPSTCDYYFDEAKYTISQDSSVSASGSASGEGWFAYNDTGVYFFHNMGSNTVTCSGSVHCVSGYTQIPNGYIYFSAWKSVNGVWSLSRSRVYQKNLWECKNCKNTVVEGNVFFQYWRDQQSSAFALTPRNQSGAEPWVAMDNLLFRRNILMSAANGPNVIGLDDIGLQTYARAVVFSHNIFDDIDGRWDPTAPYVRGAAFRGSSNEATLEVYHNTVRMSGFQNWTGISYTPDPKGSYLSYKNNVFIWDPNGQFTGDGGPSGFTAALSSYKLNPGSSYERNLNLTPSLSGAFPENNYTSNATLDTIFTSIGSPGSFSDNLRIQPSSPWSSQCSSGCGGPDPSDGSQLTDDGLDPGADIDWVETLTDGVKEGLPPLSERISMKVNPYPNGCTISLIPPDGALLELTVSSHQNMRASNVIFSSKTPDLVDSGTSTFVVASLHPKTTYWYTMRVGDKVIKNFFHTSSTANNKDKIAITVKPVQTAAYAILDYGSSPALGSTTDPVACQSGCSVRVPRQNGKVYYRVRVTDQNSVTVSKGEINAAIF